MTESYKKRLIELGAELREQMEAEQEGGDLDVVPQLLASKINHICGYIEALKESKK